MSFKFEDKLEIINAEIAKRRGKWRLYCAPDVDYDDVSQILRIHILKKWELWNQAEPLENWLNTIISNQIKNLIRNNYGNVAPPCLACNMNQGGNLCGFTPSGEQCSECPLYKKWERTKRSGYNMKIASSINNDDEHLENKIVADPSMNWDSAIAKMNKLMKKHLSPKLYKVYQMIFVDHLEEEEVAKRLGLTTKEKNKTPGYKQIYNFKQSIIQKARVLIKEEDIV